jgi:cytochrome c peroxidase/fibronectin type 3 domain-containing protein
MKSPLPSFLALVASFVYSSAIAQGPPPLLPLQPPVAPAGNPVSVAKANLGKVLFWDEQLSSTRTIACGTCHQPVSGGSDPRSIRDSSSHPGPDGLAGTTDDITGSLGVILNNAAGHYELDDFFGMAVQVTARYAPSAVNSGYAPELFWDGRAAGVFSDPVTGAVLLASGASLESQAAGPATSAVEMAHGGRNWTEVASRIAHARPLTLSPSIPTDLATWIANRAYGALFTEAFGSAGVTPSRIIMAIATYERSLVSNQSPFDAFINGTPGALTAQEQQGLNLFRTKNCVVCHGGNRLTDDRFHYIGVRPQSDDLGRNVVTGVNGDRGRMKTPSLRNVALRNEFMHQGRLETLAEVVDFYNRGGDFTAPNKDPNIVPLGLTDAEKAALVAFLGRPLTDSRVAAETGPFSRPSLYAESLREPVLIGAADADEFGNLPRITVINPPLAGSPGFTVGLDRVGKGVTAYLVMDDAPVTGSVPPSAESVRYFFEVTTEGTSVWDQKLGTTHSGYASRAIAIPGGAGLAGSKLYGKWFIEGGSESGATASFETTIFGETAGLLTAPSNLQASDEVSTSRVDLTWSAAAGATRYDIYRADTATFSGAKFLGSGATTSYVDTDVLPLEVYYYWVVSVNADEASAPGTPETGSTFDSTGFNLSASDGTSTGNVALSWSAVEGASLYRIYRGSSASLQSLQEVGAVAATSYADAGGSALQPYFYRVFALDGVGGVIATSIYNSGFRGLSAPENFAASMNLTDKIVLTWSAVSGAETYTLSRRIGSEAAVTVTTTSTNTFEDASVSPGVAVLYSLRSNNSAGAGESTGWITGQRAVSAPAGLTVAPATNPGEMQISWLAADGVAIYTLYRGTGEEFSEAGLIGTTSQTVLLDSTALAGEFYYYWVASGDEATGLVVNEVAYAAALSGTVIPDLQVGGSDFYAGDGIYNSSGTGQTHVDKPQRFESLKIRIKTENDGSLADTMRYSGSDGNRLAKLSYFRISPASANLSASIKTGQALSGEIVPGGSELLEVRVQPDRGKRGESAKIYRLTAQVRAVSILDGLSGDLVKIKLTSAKAR